MDNILSLLHNRSDRDLLTYKDNTVTQKSFSEYVYKLYDIIKDITDLKTDDFVLILNEHPITFYALLFALWLNENRVIFPTRDILNGKDHIEYYKYAVNVENDQVKLIPNSFYLKINMDKRGDTILFSSGSTGTPKGILHSKDHFLSNALSVNKVFNKTNLTNITFLKPYLISALSHFLVHYITDSHLIFEDYSNVDTIQNSYISNKFIGIVGSPMHLFASLQFIPETSFPEIFFSSGDFISFNLIRNILQRFPKSTFFNVYGLAEIAGRFFMNVNNTFTSDNRLESIGSNIDGTDYYIKDKQLHIKSKYLFYGYIRDNYFEPVKDYHPTGDLVIEKEEGLFLIGRSNDEIKILGNKLSIKYIENKIRNTLFQDTAIVIAEPHPVFGSILCLLLEPLETYSRKSIINKLRSKLEPNEIPHKFYYIEEIPFTQSMKIDRGKILDSLSALDKIDD